MSKSSPHSEKTSWAFPASEIVISALRPCEKEEGETYFFDEKALRVLECAVNALVVAPCDPEPELLRLLGLAWVLEHEAKSQSAAAAITQAIEGSDRAARILAKRRHRREERIADARTLVGTLANNARAPVFGSKAPQGAQKLSNLLDPTAQDRRRAVRREPSRRAEEKAPDPLFD